MPIFAKECICSFTMVEQTAERSKMYKKEKKRMMIQCTRLLGPSS